MLADNASGKWEVFEKPGWTGGFWVGMLWLAYEKTGEHKYLKWANSWNDATIGYEQENNHDRGFVYYYSSKYGYELTGDERYYKSTIKAAQKLVNMFQSKAKVIPQNLKNPDNVIIDTMMNLQLLWWAFINAKKKDPYKELYKQTAVDHATTTMHDFLREDGSTWQSVHYDTLTGNIIKKHTHQGFADSSCWARGQSWGLYGFAKAYEATANTDFLNSAIFLGEYIISNLPEDNVPWYDYNAPGKYKDTSAGAIAASAFFELSSIVKDSTQKLRYHQTGLQILKSLITKHLTPFVDSEGPSGILRNGCYQIFKNANSETIWGDYYLMEAIAQVIFPYVQKRKEN